MTLAEMAHALYCVAEGLDRAGHPERAETYRRAARGLLRLAARAS